MENSTGFVRPPSELESFLSQLETRLNARMDRLEILLNRTLEKLADMPTKADFDQLVADLNTETNTIAARIDALTAGLSGGLSAADAAAVQSEFQAVSDRLKALGSDPNAPIPAPAE